MKIKTIPATINRYTSAPAVHQKRRVAAYARVSTEHDEQLSSYEMQVNYYTNYIKGHEDWEFVNIYTDEGITGTSTKKREGFNQMVKDAMAGKIDLIITKSVSRFARNTVDSLTTIRKLKNKGIEVFFEKENIHTLDSKGEVLLTIMSSLAQDESRSISENVVWGMRKKFADGKGSLAYSHFLGYDKGPDGKLVVNEKQAKVVRRIYGMYIEGKTITYIARTLTKEGVPTPSGKKVWGFSTVKSILSNEKYKGDALLQKSFTVDFLSKKKRKNAGEVPQYYVQDDHEAIIDRETFDAVQQMLAESKGDFRKSSTHIFSSRIKCGACGAWYGRKLWHSKDKYRRMIWRCNDKYKKGRPRCSTPHLTEDEIKAAFVSAMNKMIGDSAEVITTMKELAEKLYDDNDLRAAINEARAKMTGYQERIDTFIKRFAEPRGECAKAYDELEGWYNQARDELENGKRELLRRKIRYDRVMNFIRELEAQKDMIRSFDESLWVNLVDYMVVYSKDDIRVIFRNGQEIKA